MSKKEEQLLVSPDFYNKVMKELTTGKKMTNEKEEITDKERALIIAKDLVELSIQTQKVLATASIPFSGIEEARLLVIMTNSILEDYTNIDELEKEESE